MDENQHILLGNALSVIERVPTQQQAIGPSANTTGEEPAWKNCWNWNLCDAAYGSLVLEVKEGRVSAELKSQGPSRNFRALQRLLMILLQASITPTVGPRLRRLLFPT